MSDIGRYGVTQHADAEMVTADQLVGERLDHPQMNQAVGASPAMFSTAPYKKPFPEVVTETREYTREKHDMHLCYRPGCRQWRKRGSDWCRHHEPAEPT